MLGLVRWFLLILLLVLSCLLSLRFGSVGTDWQDVWRLFSGTGGAVTDIIREYRLPRTAAAIVIGVYLSLSGLIFQTVLRNPLADPTLFGVSGGASLAVVIAMGVAITFNPSETGLKAASSYLSLEWIPLIALFGGLSATGLIFLMSWSRGFSAIRLILMGVILASVLQALVMAMVVGLSEARTELAILWLAGSLYARDFSHIIPALPWGAAGLLLVFLMLPQLSALRLDALTARSVGVSVGMVSPVLLVIAACFAASAVSIAGPVGFVGLIVPHISRLIGSYQMKDQILTNMVVGATLVIVGDTVGRTVLPPLEIPVGIVTSLMGAPVFALLIYIGMRRNSYA